MVSQDGGVPLLSQRGEGNTSDIEVVQERAQALMTTFQTSPSPRYLVADSKLSHEDNAANLQSLGFSTRMPHTRNVVGQVIRQALEMETGQHADEQTRSQRLELCHFGIEQRWLVVVSQAALERAQAPLSQACQREAEAVAKPWLPLQAQRFETPIQAQEALAGLAKTWRDHQVASCELIDHKRYARKGRPSADTPIQAIAWQMRAPGRPEGERREEAKQVKACCVLGTNIEVAALSDVEVIAGYKGQSQAEGGFRFLKDPLFFVASLFVKNPVAFKGC